MGSHFSFGHISRDTECSRNVRMYRTDPRSLSKGIPISCIHLSDPEKFATFVRSLKVGDKVRLVIFREGKTKKIELVVTERPILPGDLPPNY